jgi:O-antigen/teichoic acid export membrane protein
LTTPPPSATPESGPSNDSDLASKAGVLVVSKAIGGITRIAGIAILARLYPKPEFGLLSFALLTYLTVTTLAQLGLPGSIFYYLGIVQKDAHRAFVFLISRILFFIALGGAALLLLIGMVASARGYDVVALMIPLACLVVLELPTYHIQNVLIAIGKAKQSAWVTIIFSIVLFAAMVLPAVLGRPIQDVCYALVGYGAFRVVVTTICFSKELEKTPAILPSNMVRQVLSYSVPLGIADLLWKVNQFIDKYIVMFLLPVVIFAEYSVGAWEIPLVPMVATSVASVMMISFVTSYLDGNKKELLSLWNKSITKVSIIVLPLMVMLVLISRELIILLFSRAYEGAAIVFSIYTLTLFQRVADYSAVLKAINKTRIVTGWAGLTAALNLIMSVPFVLWLGMVGAAVSTLLATFIAWFFILLVMSQVLNVPLRAVFPFGFYCKTLTIAVIAAVPALLAAKAIDASEAFDLLIKVTVYFAVFAGLATLTGLAKRKDWKFLVTFFSFRQKQA